MELRWGIVGCGKISSDFVKALSILPAGHHKVVACATANSEERAKAFAQRLGLASCAVYGSYESLYKDPNVDIVYVGNMHHQHKDSVISSLKSGKHVLCEKPMGINSKEVKEMVATARQTKKFLMEAIWTRFFPAYKEFMKKIHQEKMIGDPKLMRMAFGTGFPVRFELGFRW